VLGASKRRPRSTQSPFTLPWRLLMLSIRLRAGTAAPMQSSVVPSLRAVQSESQPHRSLSSCSPLARTPASAAQAAAGAGTGWRRPPPATAAQPQRALWVGPPGRPPLRDDSGPPDRPSYLLGLLPPGPRASGTARVLWRGTRSTPSSWTPSRVTSRSRAYAVPPPRWTPPPLPSFTTPGALCRGAPPSAVAPPTRLLLRAGRAVWGTPPGPPAPPDGGVGARGGQAVGTGRAGSGQAWPRRGPSPRPRS